MTLPRVLDDWPLSTRRAGAGEGVVMEPSGIGATGIWVDGSVPEFERVAMVADQLQDIAIEDRWVPTNWPPCPHHPDRHPLVVSIHEREAVWICPVNEPPVAPIGRL
jgi:hypothetical protein